MDAPAIDNTSVRCGSRISIVQFLKLWYYCMHDVCVFDQAIYAKVMELIWKHPYTLQNWYYVLGDSHIMFNFIATVDKHFPFDGLCASP